MSNIADEKYVVLTTTKKNGQTVPTPVWIAPLPDGSLGFTTELTSGKVKRIRNFPDVTLQASNVRGVVKPGSSPVTARASVLTGDDGTAVALMLLGGRGNVSVTANLAPRLMHELCMAAIEGQARRAAEIHLRLLPLHRDLFCEPSPAPTKWAMAQLGLCGAAVRLPIVPLTAAGEATVAQALRDSGLR